MLLNLAANDQVTQRRSTGDRYQSGKFMPQRVLR